MAKTVLTNVRYFVGPADLTAQTNKVEWDDQMEEKDVTNFGSGGAKELLAGVESVSISAHGQYEAGDPGYADDEWWDARRILEAHTVSPLPSSSSLDVGDVAYLTEAVRLSGKLFGQVGDVAEYDLGASGSLGMVRGSVMQSPGSAVTADADGTAVQLGALSAGQRLVASLHVLSVAGTNTPELVVTIESDSVEAFSGSPETRLTFSTFTAVGSEVQRSSVGAHTDTWYRASFDITDNGGTGESFLVIVALGITS